MYIVELTTRNGKICETYETSEEAVRRVEAFPAESLTVMPMIYKELPDGSQRVVRYDGKPLQAHRLPEDLPPAPDEPLPLSEPLTASAGAVAGEEDEPLPLCEPLPGSNSGERPSIRVVWVKSDQSEPEMDTQDNEGAG